MSAKPKSVAKIAWGPTNPPPPPQATLEHVTELVVRAGQKMRRDARARAGGRTK